MLALRAQLLRTASTSRFAFFFWIHTHTHTHWRRQLHKRWLRTSLNRWRLFSHAHSGAVRKSVNQCLRCTQPSGRCVWASEKSAHSNPPTSIGYTLTWTEDLLLLLPIPLAVVVVARLSYIIIGAKKYDRKVASMESSRFFDGVLFRFLFCGWAILMIAKGFCGRHCWIYLTRLFLRYTATLELIAAKRQETARQIARRH